MSHMEVLDNFSVDVDIDSDRSRFSSLHGTVSASQHPLLNLPAFSTMHFTILLRVSELHRLLLHLLEDLFFFQTKLNTYL